MFKFTNEKIVNSTANTKKYNGVYAMGDAPIVVRGLVKALQYIPNLSVSGIVPKNDGERLAVVLAIILKESDCQLDIKSLSATKRTIDGKSVMTLQGRGDANWDDIPINEAIAEYLTKKSKKK